MTEDNGPEDVEMGHCLKNVGVRNEDGRDNYGRFRFLPFPVKTHVKFVQILKNGESKLKLRLFISRCHRGSGIIWDSGTGR